MSGGSMEYFYRQIEDLEFDLNSPERIALHKHLKKLSKALKAIEWNDSGDGDDRENELILAVIGSQALLVSSIEELTASLLKRPRRSKLE